MNNLKSFDQFVNEESDYRNVTGFGSMGGSGEQNAGPSFNKGIDSATYRRPDVIGVASDDINDPYFSQRRNQKRKRARKNPHIEKNREQKAKLFYKLDKKSIKEKL